MSATIIIAGALIIREALRALPGIVWSFRCPSASRNYVFPAEARRSRPSVKIDSDTQDY